MMDEPTQDNGPSAAALRKAIADAQDNILIALNKLVLFLPAGMYVDDVDVEILDATLTGGERRTAIGNVHIRVRVLVS